MSVKGIFSHKIVNMMMCVHTNKSTNGNLDICTNCGIVLDNDIMTVAITNALDEAEHKIALEILNPGADYHSTHNHPNTDADYDIPPPEAMCKHKITKMMMCTHTTSGGDNTEICTDCGLSHDTNTMIVAIDNTLDVTGHKIAAEVLNHRRNYYSICEHKTTDIDGGIPFCIECGLTFEDETVYDREEYKTDHHHNRIQRRTKRKVKSRPKPKSEAPTTQPKSEVSTVQPKPKPEAPKTTPKESEIVPKNVKDLVTIAKGRGIKNSTTMSKKTLCKILGLEIIKPDKLVLRNKGTGEEHRFKSIYRASKDMSVNPGLIHHHMGLSGVITIDGVVYDVYEV